MGVNPEDLVHQFVLAQIDVHDSNPRQERLEDVSGAGMVSARNALLPRRSCSLTSTGSAYPTTRAASANDFAASTIR
jgi:hypothetical protein